MNATAHDPVLTFAQVELGGLRFGLATEHVVQALPRPTSLSRLPRSHGALEGVFNNRGQVVPVVDLRKWMAQPGSGHESAAAPPQVMVLGAEGRVVGIAIDAVRGLLRVRASRIHPVHHDDSADSFFHSVALPDDASEPVSLLDPLRLMQQAQAWAQVTDASSTAAADSPEAMAGSTPLTPPQALLRLGDRVVAVPALHVGEVLPALPVQRLFGRDNQLSGMVRWRGRDLPLLNVEKALGIPATAHKTPRPLMLVLLWQDRGMALPVDEVVSLRRFRQADVQPTTAAGTDCAALFSATVLLGDGTQRAHMLDTERLLGMCTMSTLASQARSAEQTQAAPANPGQPLALAPPDAQTQKAQRQGHIVFDAGMLWAAPMDALLEITHPPGGFSAQPPNPLGVVGQVEWRGQSVPVLDMRQPALANADSEANQAPPKLIVVQAGSTLGALLVHDVVALLPAHVGVHTRLHMAGGELMHLLTVGEGAGQRKSYRVLAVGDLPFFAALTPDSVPA